jgi:hypothetical protein
MSEGTAYVIEMLGRTLAERDQQLAVVTRERDSAFDRIRELEAAQQPLPESTTG